MDRDAAIVMHGFLALPNREKLQLVEAINEYFDSNERESVRAAHEELFEKIVLDEHTLECKCCGRK